jgi:Ca2+-binding EF-hand superfamily protein
MKKTVVRKDSIPNLDLTQEEIDQMREQFHTLDRLKVGYINIADLGTLFEAVDSSISQEKLQQIQQWAEEKISNRKLDINAALRAWSYLKELNLKDEEDEFDYDILNTFVAMGGDSNKKGTIQKKKLIEIIKDQFGLTIDIEAMFEEAGLDIGDELNFNEFTLLLESGGSQRSSRICSFLSQASLA